MSRHLRRMGVRDLLELVGRARVLGLRVVVEVDHAALVHRDVLEDRPEGVRRAEDVRLGLGRKPDHLGVAAALDVEDAVRAPPVLVVADEAARRVGGERRLAGPGQAEEDRHVTVGPDVRRAVHREDALERQPVVHHGEDRLLDLAGVERAADHDLRARRVKHDERPRARAVGLRVGLDLGRVQHERLGLVGVELLVGRPDEHRLREQRVIRACGDDADADPMRRVGAGECVDDVEALLPGEVVDDLAAERLEVVLLDRAVDLAPPDPLLGARLADDELVLGRPSGEAAGVDDQRPALGEPPVAAFERVRVELGGGRVAEHVAGRRKPVSLQTRLRRRRRHGVDLLGVRALEGPARLVRVQGKRSRKPCDMAARLPCVIRTARERGGAAMRPPVSGRAGTRSRPSRASDHRAPRRP